jgi:hypothetical protein
MTAAQENARMLASILGIGEDEAATRLKRTVLLTVEQRPQALAWAADVAQLLGMTIDVVEGVGDDINAELVMRATPAGCWRPSSSNGLRHGPNP